jgi:hypothetical protein
MRALRLVATLLLASAGSYGNAASPAAKCQPFHDSSYDALFTAKQFATEPIGFSGKVIPADVHALRCLMAEPDALSRVRDLIAHGTLAGQLYGLVGLRALHREEFARTVRSYASSTQSVVTISGDLMKQEPVSALADLIARGEYSAKLYPGSVADP